MRSSDGRQTVCPRDRTGNGKPPRPERRGAPKETAITAWRSLDERRRAGNEAASLPRGAGWQMRAGLAVGRNVSDDPEHMDKNATLRCNCGGVRGWSVVCNVLPHATRQYFNPAMPFLGAVVQASGDTPRPDRCSGGPSGLSSANTRSDPCQRGWRQARSSSRWHFAGSLDGACAGAPGRIHSSIGHRARPGSRWLLCLTTSGMRCVLCAVLPCGCIRPARRQRGTTVCNPFAWNFAERYLASAPVGECRQSRCRRTMTSEATGGQGPCPHSNACQTADPDHLRGMSLLPPLRFTAIRWCPAPAI